MPESLDKQLDRYLAGELSGPEQRALAQAALDDPQLFDVMTAAAVVKATVRQTEFVRARTVASIARSRRTRLTLMWTGVAAAAAAVIAVVLVSRSSSRTVALPATTSLTPSATSSAATSADVTKSPAPAMPVILTARLGDPAGHSTSEFRSADARSRSPKGEGVVLSVDDGEVTVDLGSLDGLTKGSELQLFRATGAAQVPARLTITTVFRERSRGRSAAGDVLQVGDKVGVGPAVQLAALLEQVAAHIGAGDIKGARASAEAAVSISGRPGVPTTARRLALARLGTLEHRDGALDEAARHLRSAADDLDTPPATTGVERAEILNELGAVLIERGDRAEAERVLRVARPHASGAAAAHVANNLGALAALRGDRAAADALYRSALALTGGSPGLESDRRAIEKNLEGLGPR